MVTSAINPVLHSLYYYLFYSRNVEVVRSVPGEVRYAYDMSVTYDMNVTYDMSVTYDMI